MIAPGSRGTGLVRQPEDSRDLKLSSVLPTGVALPASYSLEKYVVYGVPDQGPINDCQTVTALKADEIQRSIEGLPAFEASYAYTYYFTKARDGNPVGDGGGTLRSAYKSLAGDGRCPLLGKDSKGWPNGKTFIDINPLVWWRQQHTSWSHPPYDVLPGYPIATDPTEEAHKHKLTLYMAVDQSVEAVKTAIAHNHVVSFGIEAKASLFAVNNTGIMSVPTAAEQHYGWHALTALAYDDAMTDGNYTGFFRLIGSWGDQYANNGFLWMPYLWWDSPDPNVVRPFDAWSVRYAK